MIHVLKLLLCLAVSVKPQLVQIQQPSGTPSKILTNTLGLDLVDVELHMILAFLFLKKIGNLVVPKLECAI